MDQRAAGQIVFAHRDRARGTPLESQEHKAPAWFSRIDQQGFAFTIAAKRDAGGEPQGVQDQPSVTPLDQPGRTVARDDRVPFLGRRERNRAGVGSICAVSEPANAATPRA